jgi:hypothetical protein
MKSSADKLIASGYNQVVEIQGVTNDSAKSFTTFHFTLIGQHYHDYLILDVPTLYRWQDVLPALRNSDKLVMRTISANGEVIVGYVNIVHATQFPDKLLFISYPQNLQARALRKTPRMQIEVRAQLIETEAPEPLLNGMLHDMSAQGFGFDCEGVLPCFEGQLLGRELDLRIQYSDDECESLSVRVKLVEERGPRQWRIGLECDLSDEQRVQLMQNLLLNSLSVLALKDGKRSERSISDKALQL